MPRNDDHYMRNRGVRKPRAPYGDYSSADDQGSEDMEPARAPDNGARSNRQDSFRASRGAPASFRELDRKAREEAEEEKEKKRKKDRKRLFNLLSNEALCLAIIFAMIATFNYMSSDYTGEYLTSNPQLGLVKLSLLRRAASVEGELCYGRYPNMQMVNSVDPGKPNQRMEFSTSQEWQEAGNLPHKAVFLGTISSSAAVGTLVDARGKYKLKLEKNMVASVFRQFQAHLPVLPTFQPPTWVKTEKPLIAPTKPGFSREEQIRQLQLPALRKQLEEEHLLKETPAKQPGKRGVNPATFKDSFDYSKYRRFQQNSAYPGRLDPGQTHYRLDNGKAR